jgi:hydroxypyruvate reductase
MPLRSASANTTTIIASPEELARVVARLLRERGLVVDVLPSSQASSNDLAKEYVDRILHERRGARTRARAFVRAAEPSVVVPTAHRAGKGGRSTHLAAQVAMLAHDMNGIHDRGCRRFLFAALATDGVDGSSGTGGAIIDDRFAVRVAAKLAPDALSRSLARFDTGSLHRAFGTASSPGPTGHNLADIHVLVLMP